MDGDVVSNRVKGELLIFGRRYIALDAQALCNHLDSLLGFPVAEVIINNHEFRLGKEDAERFRLERPKASIKEIIDLVITTDLLSGAGVTKVVLPERGVKGPIVVEIANPCVTATKGAGKALLLSYWCGVLSQLLGKQFDVKDLQYDKTSNTLNAKIAERSV